MSVKTYSLRENGNEKLSQNFKVSEFRCNDGSDKILIDTDLVVILQKIRDKFKKRININSGYRTPTYNAKIGGATNSYHTRGSAADISVSNTLPQKVAEYCESIGVKGIGCGANYIHVDTRSKKYYWRYVGTSTRTYSVSSFIESNVAVIKTIQRFLNSNYGKELSVDGIAGKKTRLAVKEVIKSAENSVLRINTKGKSVYILQAALYCLRYNVNGFDGEFGNGLKVAVMNFQKSKKLEADGIVGKKTWAALKEVL